ncbi:ArnT family glycosyltransferase [Algiphilus aromaticivorans]|uniref:ArnT family glycosyltransferase n=1 Tax=Algiphilus aromaticivorans TaxID=382454 RepID=UPI0018DDABE7|nr:glycosyltransferase family 39 protein [Algiphilus aromaticivorans]
MALLPYADTTEPRYAEIARIMAESGDWITPWFDAGVPFWGKPPLAFWLQALSFRALGVSEFAGRLPSWLANLGIVYLTYRTARSLHPHPGGSSSAQAGLWAALIYSTTALAFISAGTVMTDSFLALGTTLTIASLIIRLQGGAWYWGYAFFVGLAIGLLAKGPLALVLTGLPTAFWVLVTGQWRTLFRTLPWLQGTLMMLALAVPWYILAELKTPGFLDYFIVGEHFKRFLVSDWSGDLYGSAHDFPRGTIWLFLLAASFPWGLIALAVWVRGRWSGNAVAHPWQPRCPGTVSLLLAAALSPAVFFTFSGNILHTYLLPGLPFLAILTAGAIAASNERPHPAWRLSTAALIPVIAVVAGTWYAWHPGALKTERELITRVAASPAMAVSDLSYLDGVPFSARFYSRDQVRVIKRESLMTRIEREERSEPILVAVRKRDTSMMQALQNHGDAIDSSRRYTLFRIAPQRSARQ